MLPGLFIAPAERYHLIGELDRWMIREVVELLGSMPDAHDRIDQVAINLSAVSIREPGLAQYVADTLREFGVPGRLLCFEITETEAIVNLQSAGEFMHALHRLGCRFALDDFGSGFASFTYLRQLPFDTIKIDGMFVRDMDADLVHGGMVRSMTEMARLLKKPVVAEFVETEAVAGLLRELGVDWAPGLPLPRARAADDRGAAREPAARIGAAAAAPRRRQRWLASAGLADAVGPRAVAESPLDDARPAWILRLRAGRRRAAELEMPAATWPDGTWLAAFSTCRVWSSKKKSGSNSRRNSPLGRPPRNIASSTSICQSISVRIARSCAGALRAVTSAVRTRIASVVDALQQLQRLRAAA